MNDHWIPTRTLRHLRFVNVLLSKDECAIGSDKIISLVLVYVRQCIMSLEEIFIEAIWDNGFL